MIVDTVKIPPPPDPAMILPATMADMDEENADTVVPTLKSAIVKRNVGRRPTAARNQLSFSSQSVSAPALTDVGQASPQRRQGCLPQEVTAT